MISEGTHLIRASLRVDGPAGIRCTVVKGILNAPLMMRYEGGGDAGCRHVWEASAVHIRRYGVFLVVDVNSSSHDSEQTQRHT